MNRPDETIGKREGFLRRHAGHLWWLLVVVVAVGLLLWVATGGPRSLGGTRKGGARTAPAAKTMYVTAEAAIVRSRPSVSSSVLGRLDHRETVTADSVRGRWVRVAFGGGGGWVRTNLLFDGDPPPCEIASWTFSGTTVAGTLQNYTDEAFQDLRLRIIYYNELGQIVNASLVRLPDVPPASTVPERGKASFRTTTASMGTERAVRIVFGRLRPLTVTVDWTLAHETGVWWYSGIEEPRTPPNETSAEMARRVLKELGKAGE
jgi:hypothetical protein